MKLTILLIFALLLPAQSTVTGTFKNPDGSAVKGYLTVALIKPTVIDGCGGSQIVSFQQVKVLITNGTLGTLSLYPSACLSVIKPNNTTPLAFAGLAAGTGATASVTCGTAPCSVGGQVSLTISGTALPGTPSPFTLNRTLLAQAVLLTMTMQTVNGNQPYCTLVPSSTNTQKLPIAYQYSVGQATTLLTIAAIGTVISPATYTWYYSCVQPYIAYVYSNPSTLLYRAQWSVPQTGGSVDVTLFDAQ